MGVIAELWGVSLLGGSADKCFRSIQMEVAVSDVGASHEWF